MGAGLGRLLGPGLGCSVGFIVGVGVGCLVGAFVGSKVGGTNTGVGYACGQLSRRKESIRRLISMTLWVVSDRLLVVRTLGLLVVRTLRLLIVIPILGLLVIRVLVVTE